MRNAIRPPPLPFNCCCFFATSSLFPLDYSIVSFPPFSPVKPKQDPPEIHLSLLPFTHPAIFHVQQQPSLSLLITFLFSPTEKGKKKQHFFLSAKKGGRGGSKHARKHSTTEKQKQLPGEFDNRLFLVLSWEKTQLLKQAPIIDHV